MPCSLITFDVVLRTYSLISTYTLVGTYTQKGAFTLKGTYRTKGTYETKGTFFIYTIFPAVTDRHMHVTATVLDWLGNRQGQLKLPRAVS